MVEEKKMTEKGKIFEATSSDNGRTYIRIKEKYKEYIQEIQKHIRFICYLKQYMLDMPKGITDYNKLVWGSGSFIKTYFSWEYQMGLAAVATQTYTHTPKLKVKHFTSW